LLAAEDDAADRDQADEADHEARRQRRGKVRSRDAQTSGPGCLRQGTTSPSGGLVDR
jgi:hypothetical protein